MNAPTDHLAQHFPVSIKAVVVVEGKIVLLKNERNEWELPGGKLEKGEQPMLTAEREVQEELNITVKATHLLNSWVYNILGKVEVLIVTYACQTDAKLTDIIYSHEHKAVGFFDISEIAALNMPEGYKQAILLA